MKKVKLNNGRYALVDDLDYWRLKEWKWRAVISGRTIYSNRNDRTGDNQKTILMHRFILGLTDRNIHVDHIDGNGLNNQRSNLRPCTAAENCMNKRPSKSSISKYKGVRLNIAKGIYEAGIHTNTKFTLIGVYKTEIEAALAYDAYVAIEHGEFAWLNFPKEKIQQKRHVFHKHIASPNIKPIKPTNQ